MEDAGIEPPDEISLDGKIHRFNSGSKKDKSGWYVAFFDKVPAGRFGDWRLDLNVPWTADVGRDLDYEEVAARKRHIEMAREIRDKELAKLHDGVAQAVERIWENGTPATTDHPYLKKKGIQPHGMRVSGDGALMIPVHSPEGDLRSIQYIHPQGKKLFHTGGEAGGNVCVLGDLNDSPVFVAEGFATAASIREATGKPVVIAFSAHNMVEATGFVRERNGTRTDIVVVGDNDERRRAEGGEVGVRQVRSEDDTSPEEGDANDFAQRGGFEAASGSTSGRMAGSGAGVRQAARAYIMADQGVVADWRIDDGARAERMRKKLLVLHWSMLIASRRYDAPVGGSEDSARHGGVSRRRGAPRAALPRGCVAEILRGGPRCRRSACVGFRMRFEYFRRWLKVKSHVDAIGNRPVLIVVDTLHRFLNGDENSAQDAKVMIDACAGLQMGTDAPSCWFTTPASPRRRSTGRVVRPHGKPLWIWKAAW